MWSGFVSAAIAAYLVFSLSGCGLVAGAVVGAAVTPFVQPVVERIIGKDPMGDVIDALTQAQAETHERRP